MKKVYVKNIAARDQVDAPFRGQRQQLADLGVGRAVLELCVQVLAQRVLPRRHDLDGGTGGGGNRWSRRTGRRRGAE